MLKNYILITLRNFRRQPGYTLINIIGLAVGICCCTLVMFYVVKELSYDQFHPHVDRTYRILRETQIPGSGHKFSVGTDGPLAVKIADAVPEVEQAVRWYFRPCWMQAEDRLFRRRFVQADEGVFDVFSFKLKSGDLESLRRVPNSIVITEETAQMFFGDADPIGQVISSEYKYIAGDHVVVGVLENMPRNTVMGFDILTTTEHQGRSMQAVWSQWNPQSGYQPIRAFLLLRKGADPNVVEAKIQDVVSRTYDADFVSKNKIHLQSMGRVRLHSYVDYGIHSGGDINSVYTMSFCGIFLLLVACINYVNLATARSATRALEIGLRKVVGAKRSQLIWQFIGESVAVVLVASLLGLILSYVAKPYVVAFIGWTVLLDVPFWTVLLMMVPCAILLGIVAGCYPAFFLSRYQPAIVVKGRTAIDSNSMLRKGLVVFQFVLSVALITGVLIVKQQVDYLRNKNLGFDKGQVVVTRLFNNGDLRERWQSVKARFLQHPNIIGASATSTHPGLWIEYWRLRPEGKDPWRVYTLAIDEDFLEMYDVKLLEGTNVSANEAGAQANQFLLNESAVRALGWEGQVIGKRLSWEGARIPMGGTVVGVVADFHVRSLRSKIPPVVLSKYPPSFRSCSFKIRGDNVEQTIAFMEDTWKDLWPTQPFEFGFLDRVLDNSYRGEVKRGQIVQFLAILSILVACLGLVGLSAYTVQLRAKEIGIRKVLGASVPRITVLLLRELFVLVGIACVIAWPLAYYGMAQWLANYPYRIDLSVVTFVLGGLLALMVALLAVGHQTLKAALTNPVDALRSE